MSTNENKAVVRQFIKEVLMGQNIVQLDNLVAPNYVNRAMGNADKAGFKAIISNMNSAGAVMEFEIEDLIAEGDSVVFRGKLNVTLANGNKVTGRVITYYRLANGKIVEDDPMSVPAMTELMSSMMPPMTTP